MKKLANFRNLAAILAALAITAVVAADAAAQERKPMPPFAAGEWISEQKLTAEDLEGRPYVLEFWATWCAPCLESIPHLVELAAEYQPQGMIIIGMSTDWPQDIEKVHEFYKRFQMNYPVAIDTELEAKLEVRAIPAAYVVDQSGMIAWQGHPLDPKFEEAMRSALDEWVVKLNEYDALKPLAKEIISKGGADSIARLNKLAEGGENAEEAKRLKEAVNKLADTQVDRAQKAAQENPVNAIKDLDKLAEQYKGLDAADKAAQAAEAIRNVPGFADEKAVVEKMEELNRRFEAMFREKTANARDQREFGRIAAEVLEEYARELGALVNQYPNAKTTGQSRELLQSVKESIAQIKAAMGE